MGARIYSGVHFFELFLSMFLMKGFIVTTVWEKPEWEDSDSFLESRGVDVERFLERPDVKFKDEKYLGLYDVRLEVDGYEPKYTHCDNHYFFGLSSVSVREALKRAVARFFSETGGQ